MNTDIHFRLPGYGLGAGTQILGATSTTLLSTAPYTGPAAPFVALAGGITALLAAVGIGAGCGPTCVQATAYANQAETLLQQNLTAYLALPAPRPQSAQQAALSNFQQIWNGLVTACSTVSGTAGKDCVNDRKAGACKWKDAKGACWNWWNGYHDPIANDTQTYNDMLGSVTGTTAGGSATAATGGGSVLWIAAAVAGGLFLVSRL